MMTQLPAVPLYNPFDDIEKMLSRLFTNEADNYPVCNVWINEDNSDLVFEVAITGFKNEEIDVEIVDGKLFVLGKKLESDTSEPKKRYLSRKIASRNFTLKYLIPNGYDTASIDASISNGILKVILSKKKEDNVKKIEIKY